MKDKQPFGAWIGTSGYIYKHWGRGVFYPPGLPMKNWLEYYAGFFDSVELNYAFYRLPSEAAFQAWREQTPDGFRFALKGSRFITHMKKLSHCREPLRLYFSRARRLREKLSVVLWQTPPRFHKNVERLKEFLDELKRFEECRHAFEFRDPSWFSNDVYETLAGANAALCMADPPPHSERSPATADFIYLRKHGPGPGSEYPPAAIRKEAKDLERWLKIKKNIYIYYNNDAQGWAVKNAAELKKRLLSAQAKSKSNTLA